MTATRPRHSDEYTAYMRSPAWTARKRLWDATASPRQKRCQAKSWRCHGPWAHHHRRYWRLGVSILGHERHRDLVILCERHHKRLHAYQHRHHLSVRTASRHYLWAAWVRRYAAVIVLAAVLVGRAVGAW